MSFCLTSRSANASARSSCSRRRSRPQGIALRLVGDQAVLEHLGEFLQRVLARHHRAENAPALEAGARPERALLDHRQHAGIDQRRLARAAVAFDLQPAVVGRAAAALQLFGVGLLLAAETGQRFQRLLAAPEEQPRILALEGVQTQEGAAFEGRRSSKRVARFRMASSRPPGSGSAGDQRVAWNRARNGGSASGFVSIQQNGKDRQALRVVMGGKVADQRDLHLGTDPALHPVAPDQRRRTRNSPAGPLRDASSSGRRRGSCLHRERR